MSEMRGGKRTKTRTRKDLCPGPECDIPLRFCCGEPRTCRRKYEKYKADIAAAKAKIEAEQAEKERARAKA
jgi:hypothetical protein